MSCASHGTAWNQNSAFSGSPSVLLRLPKRTVAVTCGTSADKWWWECKTEGVVSSFRHHFVNSRNECDDDPICWSYLLLTFGLWVSYPLTCMLVLSSMHNAMARQAKLMSPSPNLLCIKEHSEGDVNQGGQLLIIAYCTRSWEEMNRSLSLTWALCRDRGAFVGEGDPFNGPEREEMGQLMYVRCRQISIGTIS